MEAQLIPIAKISLQVTYSGLWQCMLIIESNSPINLMATAWREVLYCENTIIQSITEVSFSPKYPHILK